MQITYVYIQTDTIVQLTLHMRAPRKSVHRISQEPKLVHVLESLSLVHVIRLYNVIKLLAALSMEVSHAVQISVWFKLGSRARVIINAYLDFAIAITEAVKSRV